LETQKRKSLTVEMEQGLEKIKRVIAIYSELPKGLTTRLMQFMEPYAAMATLRRRICTDGELEAGEGITQAPPGASPLVRRIPAILVLV